MDYGSSVDSSEAIGTAVARKLQDQMTDEEYVHANGVLCPFCRKRGAVKYDFQFDDAFSEILEGDGITLSSELLYIRSLCESCDAKWYDKFILTGWLPHIHKSGST